MSRASLVETYIAALPYAAVSIVPAAPGSRVEIGGRSKPTFYFQMNHIELVLLRAGLSCGPTDQPADAVAERLISAARSVGAPFQTPAEIRKAAERQVDKIVAEVKVAA